MSRKSLYFLLFILGTGVQQADSTQQSYGTAATGNYDYSAYYQQQQQQQQPQQVATQQNGAAATTNYGTWTQ